MKKETIAIAGLVLLAALFCGCTGNGGPGEDGADGAGGSPGDDSDQNETLRVEYFTESGNMGPVGITGIGAGATKTHTFTVNEGAVALSVICDGSNGTSGRGDIDMEMRGANDPDRVATSASGGSYERIDLDRKDIEKRYGYGEYEVTLIEYAGMGLAYTLHIYVYFPGNTTSDDEGGR